MGATKKRRRTILFVRGFNTDGGDDVYAFVKVALKAAGVRRVVFFKYSPDDDLLETYARLCKTIRKTRFTHLIGHSMGGGLLLKYMSDSSSSSSSSSSDRRRIILLMPLACKVPLYAAIAPFARGLRLPQASILPATRLRDSGNLLNDEYGPIPIHQICDMYNVLMLESDRVVVATLNRHPDAVLFYATEESVNVISISTLRQIRRVELVQGRHESFNGLRTCESFFERFLSYV